MMTKLKPIGRKMTVGGKGQVIEVDNKIKEIVYLDQTGYFSSSPPVPLGTKSAWNLASSERSELLEEGYRLWKYDPIGGIIITLTTHFVLGRGLDFQFDDEKAQFFAKKFWSKNNMDLRSRPACDELTAYGELFIWLRPKSDDVQYRNKILWRAGDTQVTFIHPDNITSISTADEDVGDIYSYTYEWKDSEENSQQLEIPDISKFDIENDIKIGCMMHIKLNAGNNDPFGLSDLIRVKEWLDNYQEYLRDGVIINKLYRSPCFDISIEDADEAEIAAATSRYNGWKIGNNPVHNQKETWSILEFTGPNTSQEAARRSLLLIIAAGVGFAEYMLADGANANLASTKSQQLPVIKKFEDRQDLLTHYFGNMLQFALMIKSHYGNSTGLEIVEDEEGDYTNFQVTLQFPSITQDADRDIAETNKIALANGYMSLSTAAGRLGLDLTREFELIKKDQQILDQLSKLGINIVIGTPPEQTMNIDESPNSKEGKSSSTRVPEKDKQSKTAV